MDEIIGQITAAEYWEWRHSISEWKKTELELQSLMLKLQVLEKEAELKKCHLAIQKTSVRDTQERVKLMEKEYHAIRERIGNRIGIELKDCLIDDVTYEVKKISDNKVDTQQLKIENGQSNTKEMSQ